MPPRRRKEGAAPGKARLLDQTKPGNRASDKPWEELKAEFVADLAGPKEPPPANDDGADSLDLPATVSIRSGREEIEAPGARAKAASEEPAGEPTAETLERALGERERELREELTRAFETRSAELAKEVEAHEEKLSKRFEACEATLRQQVDKLKAELSETESRLEEVKAQLNDLAERGTAETPPTWPAARKRKTGSRPRGGAKPKAGRQQRGTRTNGRLDLNAATFEELRSLGLSVNQSARVIAYRDTRGGYGSLDELDGVPGLPKATRAELRSRLKLGS